MDLITKYFELKNSIPKDVQLIAVTKNRSIEEIKILYDLGHRDFGENRVQELLKKKELLPDDINWHMIGHLQTNKVKYIAPFIQMIHSVDDVNLLTEINKRAQQNNRIIDCLLEVHIAKEHTKSGFQENDLYSFFENFSSYTINNIRICGLMGMATFTTDYQQIEFEFNKLKSLFDSIKSRYMTKKEYFKHLSMGMSNDYQIAIKYGATFVRIGSLLFDI